MIKQIYLFIVLMFLLFNIFCNERKGEKKIYSTDIYSFDSLQFDTFINECRFLYSRKFPVFNINENLKLSDSLNTFIQTFLGLNQNDKSISIKQEFKNFVLNNADIANTNNENDYKTVFENTGSMQVYYISKEYVCLKFDFYEYSGGAHGMYGSLFFNFDKSGKMLHLKDIVMNNKKLIECGEKYFRMNQGLSHDENIENAGYWFTDNKFHLNENVALLGDSLEFCFNPYEIASYAQGQIFIKLPISCIN
ncbi:MAG: DUF3298 domain-containing protein [Bacteroidia bacterium]